MDSYEMESHVATMTYSKVAREETHLLVGTVPAWLQEKVVNRNGMYLRVLLCKKVARAACVLDRAEFT